jgi:Flp pilus assembly pilin Flp
MMLVQDSIDVIARIGCDQNGRTRQNHDNNQPDCQHTHHRRKCTPPSLSFVKSANLECKSQRNYESVRATPYREVVQSYREAARDIMRKAWSDDGGQDIAEYAVMLAVILVLVVGTIRLVGSNANTAFSQAASSIQ